MTVVALDEVDPVVLAGGSWSRILIDRDTASAASTTLGFSVFAPGTSTDHMNHVADELAYVVSGTGLIQLEDRGVRLPAESACHIPAGLWHAVVNDDPEIPLTMVFVFDSPGYPPTDRRPYDHSEGAQ